MQALKICCSKSVKKCAIWVQRGTKTANFETKRALLGAQKKVPCVFDRTGLRGLQPQQKTLKIPLSYHSAYHGEHRWLTILAVEGITTD
jgi:hypothetical protein